MGPTTPRCSCPATTPASPTSTRAPRPRSTRPTSTRPPPTRPVAPSAAGTYEYAVTDQFNGADSTSTDQSQAYVTDGLQGDLAPSWSPGRPGRSSWCGSPSATRPTTSSTGPRSPAGRSGPGPRSAPTPRPDSATLPDNSSGDTSPAQTATVCSGPTYAPTSCAGEQELTFTDTGGTTGAPAGVTYLDTPMPAGWTPPIVENANELPWEQNPYFTPALTRSGSPPSGPMPPRPTPTRPMMPSASGPPTPGPPTPPASPSSTAPPRWPPGTRSTSSTTWPPTPRSSTSTTPCTPRRPRTPSAMTPPPSPARSTLFTFPQVINQVVSGMFTNMLSNDPEVSYVHQTNTHGDAAVLDHPAPGQLRARRPRPSPAPTVTGPSTRSSTR